MEIIRKGELKLVGIRLVCSSLEEYQQKIPSIVDSLTNRLGEIANKVNPHIFIGIHMVDATEETDGYWKCVEVSSFEQVPEDLSTIILQEQTYATIKHEGIPWAIHQTYEKMNTAIEASEYERIFDAWTLETYNQTKQSEGWLNCQLFNPIKVR